MYPTSETIWYGWDAMRKFPLHFAIVSVHPFYSESDDGKLISYILPRPL